MSLFFLLVELLLYGFTFYLFLKKKDLALLYLPALIFAYIIINPKLPASVYYGSISLVVLSIINRNPFFYRNNYFAVLLGIYFIVLLFHSSDPETIRPFVFSVLWFFTLLPTISSIYRRHSKEVLFKELTLSASIILALFIANVVFSSIFKYQAHAMYGISKGILYGNLAATDFNVLAIASFVVILALLEKRTIFHLSILLLSFSFIMLSMRRSVMGVTILGFGIAALLLASQKGLKQLLSLGSIVLSIGFLIFSHTDFKSTFTDRYELRKLDERELEEEKRFEEYELVYKDMFVYHDYSPWFGYELFKSGGNYGRGLLGEERSLHTDITNIAHSSGILGVILYLLMVSTAFMQSYRTAKTKPDKYLLLYSAIAFVVFTVTGRYTQVACSLLLFLVLQLPLAKKAEESDEFTELEEQLPPVSFNRY